MRGGFAEIVVLERKSELWRMKEVNLDSRLGRQDNNVHFFYVRFPV